VKLFPPFLPLTQPKLRLIRQLATSPINKLRPVRIVLQLSWDSLLYVNTIYHSQWRNWRGAGSRIASSWQAKRENRTPT